MEKRIRCVVHQTPRLYHHYEPEVSFGIKRGVIIDRCRKHGVWLEGRELRHFFEWLNAGRQAASAVM